MHRWSSQQMRLRHLSASLSELRGWMPRQQLLHKKRRQRRPQWQEQWLHRCTSMMQCLSLQLATGSESTGTANAEKVKPEAASLTKALAAQPRRSIGSQPISACLGLGGHGNSEIGARFSLRGALLDGEVLGTLECKHPHEWLCPRSPVFVWQSSCF